MICRLQRTARSLRYLSLPKNIKNRITLNAVRVNAKGDLTWIDTQNMTRTGFCHDHSLQMRDFRQIETPQRWSNSGYYSSLTRLGLSEKIASSQASIMHVTPTILSRHSSIIITIMFVRAVIKKNEVILFTDEAPSSPPADPSGKELSLPTHPEDNPWWDFLYNLQEQLKANPVHSNAPFEFQVLEIILDHVISELQQQLEHQLQPEVLKLLDEIDERLDKETLQRLLLVHRVMTRYVSNAIRVRDALGEVLSSDADMAAMYLSLQPRAQSDHEEVELMLEHYVRSAGMLAGRASDLNRHIESAEDISQIALDQHRNQLLRLDLQLTMATVSLALGAFGASIFGMNLQSGLEHHPQAFQVVSGSLILTSVTMYTICIKFRRQMPGLKNGH